MMKTIEGDIDEMAAESAQDRRDHAKLGKDLEWLLAHEDAMRVPMACRHLVDVGVDPVVIAKTMLIGDRDGGTFYVLTSRALALADHEAAAGLWITSAIVGCPVDVSAVQLVAGAVWLATQYKLERSTLRSFVVHAERRLLRRPDFKGYGAVDLVDSHGVKDRAWMLDSIDHAQLPSFAPLEYSPT